MVTAAHTFWGTAWLADKPLSRPVGTAAPSPWRSAQGVSRPSAARRGIVRFPQSPLVTDLSSLSLPRHLVAPCPSTRTKGQHPPGEHASGSFRGRCSNSCDGNAIVLTLRQESQRWVSIRLTKPVYRRPDVRTQLCPSVRSRGAIASRELRVPSGDSCVPREACIRAGTPGQRTLPRGFSGPGGSSGAVSGAPS